MSITIHEGSIFDVEADVIVNPANSFLNHSGGLARVIDNAATAPFPFEPGDFRAAGAADPAAEFFTAAGEHAARVRKWTADNVNAPLLATGNVHMTSAGVMPFRACAHVVGPIWNGGDFCEADLLEIAYDTLFDVVIDEGYESVVVPAISCGVFRYPVVAAARIAVAVARWSSDELDITFALTDPAHVAAYAAELNA